MIAPPIPKVAKTNVPAVTMEQMREVDRIMIEDLHIQLMQMMENAGRNLAWLAMARFSPRRVVVLAGPGGNGGGGLVAGRHLANWGVAVRIVLARERDGLAPVPGHQLEVLERMQVPVGAQPEPADLYLDALIGYSLAGDPRGRTAELIEWLNLRPEPVLSLDTPSGLNVTTGARHDPCVAAAATLTLAAPKTGLLDVTAVGELYLADISVPAAVYEAFGLEMPAELFAGRPVVELV